MRARGLAFHRPPPAFQAPHTLLVHPNPAFKSPMIPRSLLRPRPQQPTAPAPLGLALPSRNRSLSTSSPARHPPPPRYRRFGDPASCPQPRNAPGSAGTVLPFGLGRRAGGSSGGGARFSFGQRVANVPPIVWVVAGGGGLYFVFHLEKSPTGRCEYCPLPTEQGWVYALLRGTD